MNLKITPATLSGVVTPPPSKSYSHRALIAAALADSDCQITNLADSKDIFATRRCLQQLLSPGETLPMLDCGESGSTLRFLIPVALALRGGALFTGQGRLMERPQTPYFNLFEKQGISYRLENDVLAVNGHLSPGTFCLPGNVSSQFVTGLLYALPLLEQESVIRITSPLESLDYVAMTLDVLEQFGIRTENENWHTFRVPGNQRYLPQQLEIEADWSQAGFFFSAVALGSKLEIRGMNPRSVQGDMRIVPYHLKLSRPGDVTLDVSQCPDLVPPLAVHAAVRSGTTYITNAARLRIKESDRLAAVTQVLNALGARVTEGADHLIIEGQPFLPGGTTVSACNDHRIAMMAAIAATRCKAPIILTGAQCVAKSYPNFWVEYARLGGRIEEVTP